MRRAPLIRAFGVTPDELVIDNFAGGGGASSGIEAALGRPVDIAINHDPEAIAMHKANHPETKHFCENIWDVDPRVACGSRPVGLAWFSPDCTHFSRAKGSTPKKKEIRALADVVIRWAETVRPRIILLENVEEFQTWGPLDDEGYPIKASAGDDFRAWYGRLSALGYAIEFQSLVAADYGAPTSRKRLYLIARCDGHPKIWPDATHAQHEWRQAHEIIDWSLPCPSIFLSKEEGKRLNVRRPLVEASLNRIAMGIKRFVIDAPTPFIIRHGHYSTKTGAGLREGCGAGTFRGQSLKQPLATVCATNDKHLVVPVITKHYTGVVGHEVMKPLGAITSRDHHALSAAFLTKYYGTSVGASLRDPLPTVTGQGNHLFHTRAFLVKYYGSGGQTQQLDLPLHTVTAKARFGLIVIEGQLWEITDIGMRMLRPHELFAAQGFPDWYKLDVEYAGKPLTIEALNRLCGNSVSPMVSKALAGANATERMAA